ncbi:MAG: ISKra4 family transposase [Desulfobacterales bacterium]|nr:ISKra4 family transposase [Desulfobacterales bacterium]
MDSITDITKSLFQNRSEIMGQAALALIEKKFGHLLDQHYCECPLCNRRIKAKSEKVRREIDTVVGPVTLYRPYFYCTTCSFGFYPLDDALGLSNRKAQLDIQELEAWLTAEMPYETASEALERCAGIKLSNHHAHDVVNEIAADIQLLDICPDKAEIHRKIDQLSEDRFRRPVLMVGIDGAHSPTRPEPSPRKGKRGKGEWKEVKGFRMYLVADNKIVHLISWHQIASDKELGNDLLKIKQAGLIPEDKVRICAIGDGAPWIWNRIKEVYPDAKKVLDYYHCSAYLHDLANAQYGKNSQKAREWIEATLTRLFMNNADQIIAGIKRMKPISDEAKDQIDKTVGYLEERKDMVNYGSLKRGGFHIGSGGIESSNKFIANVRLKRSGAWWYPSNANNILKLRCAKYNKTFDRIMENRKVKIKQNRTCEHRPNLHLIADNS